MFSTLWMTEIMYWHLDSILM